MARIELAIPRPRPPFCAAGSFAAAAAAVVAAIISRSEMRPTRGAAFISLDERHGCVVGPLEAHASTGNCVASAKRVKWLKNATVMVSSTISLSVNCDRTFANCSSFTPWMSLVSSSA